jgi:hypothetical protein
MDSQRQPHLLAPYMAYWHIFALLRCLVISARLALSEGGFKDKGLLQDGGQDAYRRQILDQERKVAYRYASQFFQCTPRSPSAFVVWWSCGYQVAQ